jgi:hypothetical protein
LPFSTAFIA